MPKKGSKIGSSTESADVPDDFYADGKIADEAIRRLKASDGKPFFLAVGFIKPHLPFVAPEKYWNLYDAETLPMPEVTKVPTDAPSYAPQFGGELHQYADIPPDKVLPQDLQCKLIHGYYAATSYADAQIGRVLDALEESSLAENTIVVLWGDHGWHLGDHGMWCKHTNYEQAARIPLLISKPGAKPGSGAKSDSFVETVDLFPTLCAMAGLQAPGGSDGISLSATLADPTASVRNHIIHVYPRRDKLGRAIRTERYRLVEWKVPGAPSETAELELYDYKKDPLETKNIAATNPETVSELLEILKSYPEPKPQLRPEGQEAPEKAKADRTALFNRRDADKDGRLTFEEFLMYQDDVTEAKARFPRFDKNGDGVLSRDEFGR